MMTVFYILVSILAFGLLILAHEFGHFFTAKLSGVKVNEFSLFMGPAIWKKQKGETLYALRCIPLGGYCAMEGEDGDSDNPRAFGKAKVWKRIVILVAGATMNFIAGFLMMLLFIAISCVGIRKAVPTSEITKIEENRPFAQQLQVGDELYRIDGHRIYVPGYEGYFLDRNSEGIYDIEVIRDGKKILLEDVVMKRDYVGEDGNLYYGLSIGGVEAPTFSNIFSHAYCESVNVGRMVWLTLGDLLTGRESVKNMTGVVGVVDVVADVGVQSETVSIGMLNVLYIFAMISINLGVMNLLPIPALDGGRVVTLLLTALIEKLTGKKLDPKYEGYLNGAFMLLLIAFMLLITFKDVWKIFS
ncbi:MAG: site-2 protease family protein [Oscillospiraceae bacterium]|nr:site-2 protease family protein [Oscillospiraceae bacterium]